MPSAPAAQTTDARAAGSQAWVRLLRAHAAATRALNARLLHEHGLTVNDYEALLLLADAEEHSLRRTDLARSLELTASGVTRLLDGLETAGLVAKATCARDARVSYAVLTEAGRERLADASRSYDAALAELFAGYGADELDTLAELLGRLPGATRIGCPLGGG